MTNRRPCRHIRERWVADHYGQIKSPLLLQGHMDHRQFNCANLAEAVAYERIRGGSTKGVTRQMISYLKTGKVKTCEPDLARAIEKVLDVPEGTLFDVLPKSRATRQDVKGCAA